MMVLEIDKVNSFGGAGFSISQQVECRTFDAAIRSGYWIMKDVQYCMYGTLLGEL